MTARAPERRAFLYFTLAAISFGVMAFATKLATAELSGAEVAFLRFILMLLPLALVPSLLRRALVFERLDLLLYRGVFGGLAVLLYFLAIEHVPVGLASLLNHSSPVWAVLFATLFLGERLTWRRLLPLGMALSGLALVVSSHLQGNGGPRLGFWAGVGFVSAMLSGAAVAAIRAARRTEGSWAVYGSFSLFGLLATAPLGLWQWRTPSLRAWVYLVIVGVSSVAAQLLMTHAYRWVDNLRAGVFTPISPVVALLLGAVILGEPVTVWSLLGTALALAGVVATVMDGARPAPPVGGS
ncbi:MAG: DMT family transporter [Acidobacteria bacterium]|nr:DMT family transporter [Acidobacteriota bacterium]HNZ95938.1 DMT family transporter [Thermoanaerobaculia bacterium]NLN12102.1 DMT family transporter [Acidobacteriota bacterium]HPA96225.1 DMT family transporter [Thermoanaerobaculia bacterium]HQN38005.1 DMT family transporter [Thermoanaerobaculia bacterium]